MLLEFWVRVWITRSLVCVWVRVHVDEGYKVMVCARWWGWWWWKVEGGLWCFQGDLGGCGGYLGFVAGS